MTMTATTSDATMMMTLFPPSFLPLPALALLLSPPLRPPFPPRPSPPLGPPLPLPSPIPHLPSPP